MVYTAAGMTDGRSQPLCIAPDENKRWKFLTAQLPLANFKDEAEGLLVITDKSCNYACVDSRIGHSHSNFHNHD
jgi:hypothetical protein